MDNQMIAELYRSANHELRGFNIPRHEFIDLRQELVCQTLVQYRRLKERGKEPDLILLKHFLRLRKKELATRSFVGKNGGGTSQRDIMNQKHQWDGTFEKVDFVDDLPNSKMNTKFRAEENMSFFVDFSLFLKKLSSIQQQIISLLMKGFKLKEICRRLRQSDYVVEQMINSVKEAYLKYFEVELQLVNN
jgi:hypothetical protein